MKRLLPTDYFHVVFTVPDDLLNGIVMRNRELFFDAMFAAASQTLLELGNDEKRLGAQVGFTAVLHTWTKDLRFHPHVHCIVTGGGLTADGAAWKATRRDYLFPVAVLSKLFRGKLVAALDEAYRDGRLDVRGVDGFVDVPDADAAWRRLRKKLYRTKWVSYAKPPFASAETVYQYLGRYTHRVGLSNKSHRQRRRRHRHLPHLGRTDGPAPRARIPSPIPAARVARRFREAAPLRPARARQRQLETRDRADAARCPSAFPDVDELGATRRAGCHRHCRDVARAALATDRHRRHPLLEVRRCHLLSPAHEGAPEGHLVNRPTAAPIADVVERLGTCWHGARCSSVPKLVSTTGPLIAAHRSHCAHRHGSRWRPLAGLGDQ
jgi:hypothetical protein